LSFCFIKPNICLKSKLHCLDFRHCFFFFVCGGRGRILRERGFKIKFSFQTLFFLLKISGKSGEKGNKMFRVILNFINQYSKAYIDN